MTEQLLLNRKTLQSALSACEQFEAQLSSFVDGELDQLDHQRAAEHIEGCLHCRTFVNSLAGLADLNRQHQGDLEAQRFLAGLDSEAMFTGLTRKLLTDARSRLSGVLYELGKALISAGLRTSPHITEVPFFVKKPGSVATLKRKGERLAREYSSLRREYAKGEKSAPELKKSGLFPRNDAVRSSPAFESGRVCLEECLKLSPVCHEARIYLAHYFGTVGRFDKARQQIRTLMRQEPPRKMQIHGAHVLGRIYSAARQFVKACEMERKVLEAATKDEDLLMQAGSLTNLAVYAFKLGRYDEVESSLDRLVREFPSRLEDMVLPTLQRSREIRQILQKDRELLGRLRRRFPTVFGN